MFFKLSKVHDSEQKSFVSFKKALDLCIINTDTNEYIDSKTGAALPLHLALRRGKVKIAETTSKYLSTSRISLKDTSFAFSDDTDVLNASKRQRLISKSSEITSEHSNERQLSPIIPTSEPHVSTYESSNLVKDLLVRNPTNENFISFEVAIQINIYNADSGKLKNFTTTDTKSISELLKEGLIKSENSNILLDDSQVYYVDGVVCSFPSNVHSFRSDQRVVSLDEAKRKSIIDVSDALYILPNGATLTIREAMEKRFILGKMFTPVELKIVFQGKHYGF